VPGPPVPVKLAKTLHHTGPDRIQTDISHQLKEIFILLNFNFLNCFFEKPNNIKGL
jgi:anti-anti-sigma regulatory factor